MMSNISLHGCASITERSPSHTQSCRADGETSWPCGEDYKHIHLTQMLLWTTTMIASVLAIFWVSEPSSATVVHFCISWLKNVLAHNGFWRTDLSCKMISNLSIAIPPPASSTLPSAIRAFVFVYACVVSLESRYFCAVDCLPKDPWCTNASKEANQGKHEVGKDIHRQENFRLI